MRIKITGALVQAQDSLYGYFGGQSGSGMGLSLSASVLLTASLNETPTHTRSYITADTSDPIVLALDGG